jgi:pyruvate dehydrogenase E1 component alpha subunit
VGAQRRASRPPGASRRWERRRDDLPTAGKAGPRLFPGRWHAVRSIVHVAPAIDTLDRDRAHALLRGMLRIRRFEEKAAELYTLGKIRGFLHLYIGEEAIAVGAMEALAPEDAIVSTYREHGHALARGLPADALMAELYGKANGCSRGRGGSMHFFDVGRRFYGGYAIVAGGLPIAVGLALADHLQLRSRVTACFFGDGAVDEGEFAESLNLAALWQLPVLFVCENNLYAMGTALARHQAQTDITRKAAGHGVPAAAVDGMDVLAVETMVREAAATVRRTGAPFLVEARTYRFRAHSMADPELYRSKAEVEEWRTHDPIAALAARLRERALLTDADFATIADAVEGEIAAAVACAEAGPWEPVEDLTKDVYTPCPA